MPHATGESGHKKPDAKNKRGIKAAMVEASAVAAPVAEKAARAVVAKAGREQMTAEAEVPKRKEVQSGDSSTHGQRRKSALPTS